MNSQCTTQVDARESNLSLLDKDVLSDPALENAGREQKPAFDDIVERYYRPLFQFALSLTRCECEACDLTQQTFYIWSIKGGQLRDAAKLRAWLFTTLHRAFLQSRRHKTRFPHYELSQVDAELPQISALSESRLDSEQVLEALKRIDELFRAPVALFYLEDYPYKDIAAILNVPLGTVKSRIARGIAHLQKLLMPARPSFARIAA
jgi:RNA polymerase sigma-70 factor (ECF subfamily)